MMPTSAFQSCKTVAAVLILALAFIGPAFSSERKPWPMFADRFIEQYFQYHPSFAAGAGRHEFDGKLPDWSPQALQRLSEWLDRQRRLTQRYADAGLTPSQRFEREHLLHVIGEELFWLRSVRSPTKSPMYYSEALDPNFYLARPYAPLERRMRAFIAYAGNIPRAASQIRTNLQSPLPRTYIDVGKTLFSGLAAFYENDAKAAFSTINDPKLRQQFAQTVPAAAKAMRELTDWLEQQRPRATEAFALGADKFREMLNSGEGVDLPLETLEKLGRADLDRNLAVLNQECQRYAPDQSAANCVAKVESQKPALGPVSEARGQLALLKAFLAEQDLLSIPGSEAAGVAESPPFKRWNSAYIDIPGPFETGLPSVYYVAPPDPAWSPAEQAAYVPSKANLLFISAHEVWPGHFLQHLHGDKTSSKIGLLFNSYAFSEGWAHYAEELMWEAGLNAGDAQTHIGQLLNALIRNVRFLSALGLHTQGMTVEASEKMFRELAFRDQGNARQQAARGTFDPGYLNYTLGKLMIRKLRDDWTASRGGRAAWKAFHDAFLSYGAPPIPMVRKAMLGDNSGSSL